jgi:hypothetical protein
VVARLIGDPRQFRLLDIDEKISLEYVFALFVLLRLFVGTVLKKEMRWIMRWNVEMS